MTTNNKEDKKIKVAITHGDINGVGYEVILKTFGDSRMYDICTPVLYGSTKVASYHKKLLTSMPQEMTFSSVRDASEAQDRRFNVINLTQDEIKIDLGKSTDIAGKLSRESLNRACDDLKAGKVDVLVTAPINKRNIQAPDFDFPATPNISRISSVPPRLCSWSATVSASASSPTTLPSRTSPQRLHTTCFLIN